MFLLNTLPTHGEALDPQDASALGAAGAARAHAFLAACGEPRPTPIWSMPAPAEAAQVGLVHLKDEADRLGLGSFKALGGSYAVTVLALEAASRRLGRAIGFEDLGAPDVRAVLAGLTFACATDGNHGRAVAAGARRLGARSVIFVHEGVSAPRVQAIAAFGAEIVRVRGSYDDSVAEAATRCAEEDWTLAADTAPRLDDPAPGLVMQGYTAIADEALAQLGEPPTHVFLQAGVGGLAASLAAHMAVRLGSDRPRVVVVEPDRAACLLETARAGRLTKIAQGPPTIMAMLECCQPSAIAWRILSRLADAFMTVEDAEAVAAMVRLGKAQGRQPQIVAGESGGVGVAGLLRLAADGAARRAIALDAGSRILVINTEGATDPQRYQLLVGRQPAVAYG